MKNYFILVSCLCLTFVLSLYGNTENNTEISLSGKLVRKYFDAPPIVKNPAFGWFLELDSSSKNSIAFAFSQLDDEDKRIYSDFDLNIVQLMTYRNDEREECQALEGQFISINGKLWNPPHIYRAIPCY